MDQNDKIISGIFVRFDHHIIEFIQKGVVLQTAVYELHHKFLFAIVIGFFFHWKFHIHKIFAKNLALAKRRGKTRLLRPGITKAERAEYKELLKILNLGLEDRLTSKVGLLSGGQRQALTLLMATLQKPKLLLLDEHTAALDPKTAAKVLDITDKIVNRDHLTTLMITHNMKDAIAHGNRLIMMMNGKIVLDIQGEEKKKLTVKQLLDKFEEASGEEFSNDSAILG